MDCRFCGALNEEDDHRCTRCGRRLRASTARPAPDTYPVITSAAAPALANLYQMVAKETETVTEGSSDDSRRFSYQRALFSEMPRVMPTASVAVAEPPRSNRATRTRNRRTVEGQQSLSFQSPLDTQVEAVIFCDAPVALPTHRMIASALDLSVILMGLAVFLVTFHLAGGEIVLTKQTIPFFCTIAAVFALFYHFLFCISGGDSPGMRWAQLRLVNFDGQPPDREQRVYRLIGSCLSILAAGLGLIWALVDEESLTWHDHMSNTFPSPLQ